MKPRPLLFNADPAVLGGNGPATVIDFPAASPAATVALAAAVPAAEAPAAPGLVEPVAAAEPTLLEKVTASIQSKGKLLADRDAATLRADRAESELATLRADLAAANSELATLRKERTDIQAALVTAQAEKQEVDTAAASQIAALGFDAASLPAASVGNEETKEDLAARIEKETDPAKNWALIEKYEAL